MLTVDILPGIEKEARERQGARTDIREKFPQSDKGKATEKAAAMVGVNPRYISDMKKLVAEEPELVARVRSGELKLMEALRQARRRVRHFTRDEGAATGG